MKRIISLLMALVLLLGTIPVIANAATELTITQQPKSVTVAEGAKARVTVKATGDGLTYKWYYKDVGASGYKYTSSFTSNTYSIAMNAARDGRSVLCKITDKYGNTVKTKAVTVNMGNVATVTQQPKSVTVAEGAKARVTVKATGDGLTYKWYYKDAGASGYKYTSSFKSNSYSVAMNAARDGRSVLCKITDKYGNTVSSNAVTINMAKPVTIIQQPVSVTVAEGEKAKVTVKATGDGLTYKWYYKDAGAADYKYTSSFKSSTYSVAMNAARDGRSVLCKITDKYGNTVSSDAVTINMAKPVTITQQPVSVTVAEGEKASVTVKATGDGLTYKWYYKDAGAAGYKYTSSFKSNTYSVVMNAARAGRQVYCVVTDKYGNTVQTNSVTINMKPTVLTVTRQPADAIGKPDTTAVFTVAVGGGKAPYTYQWQYCALAIGEEVYDLEEPGIYAGVTTDTLNVSPDESAYLMMTYVEMVFRCVVTDAAGTTVTSDWAHIQPGELILNEIDCENADIGEVFTAEVFAYGMDMTYRWYYKDLGASEFSLAESFTGPTYSVTMTEALMGRQIYCVVTDKFGNSELTDTVFLQAAYLDLETLSGVQEAEVGDQVTFVVEASGGIAPYTYQWQYSYEDIEGRTDFVDCDSSSLWYSGGKTDQLTVDVSESTINNKYRFQCIVTDAAGQTVSTGGYVHVYLPFKFVQQPQNVYAGNGDQVTFSVEVEGGRTDEYRYTWEYSTDGVSYSTVFSTYSWVEDVSDGTLTVTVDAFYGILDRYMFRCKAAPGFGSDYIISDTVMIKPALKITGQPQDVTCESGETVSFSVAVTGGEAPYTYQWQYMYDAMSAYGNLVYGWASGVNTDTLSFTAETADFEDHYSYRCVITDAAGNQVISEPASALQALTVNTQPEDVFCLAGDTVSFFVAVTGGVAPYRYQWQYSYVDIGGPIEYVDCSISAEWYSGSQTNQLTVSVSGSTIQNGYCFRCIIIDAAGNQVVSDPAAALQVLTVNTQPEDVFCLAGDTVSFSVAVAGGTSPYTYQWQYKYDGISAYRDITGTWASGANTDTLSFEVEAVDFEENYSYRCVITDAAGNQVISESASPLQKLHITTQPVNVTCEAGDTARFSVAVAGGKAPYTYKWQYITDSSSGYESIIANWASGTTTDTLVAKVASVDFEKHFRYRCVITDANGDQVISNVVCPVPKALKITTQPVSKTAAQDDTVTFSVAVSGGSGSYTYQWQQMPPWTTQWQDLRTSATLSVEVSSLHVQYRYQYRCIITDSLGNTVTTYTVTLN